MTGRVIRFFGDSTVRYQFHAMVCQLSYLLKAPVVHIKEFKPNGIFPLVDPAGRFDFADYKSAHSAIRSNYTYSFSFQVGPINIQFIPAGRW